MADTYVKLDSVLGLIERVKALYKENPNEHPINYGTMVGLEVGINTSQLFTEQNIIKPYFDRLSNEVLRATWDDYYMPVNTLSCDEIRRLMDNVLSDKEIGR